MASTIHRCGTFPPFRQEERGETVNMRLPSFARFRREKAWRAKGLKFQGSFIHPRPEFYKYYFYVFTEDSPEEGRAFFRKENRLCIHDYLERKAEINARKGLAWVYNVRLPRRGPATPFDENHPRWKDAEWAPPLDEDPDPPVEGGHR
jgi:hypothetical protein